MTQWQICYSIYVISYYIRYIYIFFVLFRYFFYIYIWFDTSLFVWTHLFHRMPSKGHCKSPFHLSGLIADTVAAFLLLHTSSKSTRQSQSQHNEARRRNSLSQRLWLWTSPCDVSSWYISGIVGHDSNTRITWHDFAPVVSGKNDDSKRRLWNKLKSTGVIPGHLLLQIILMGLHCSFQDLVLGGFLVSPWYPTTLRRFDTCKIWRSDPSWGFETVGITSTVDSAVDDSLLEGACFFVGPNWLGCMWIVGKEADNEGFEMFFRTCVLDDGIAESLYQITWKRIHFLAVSKISPVLLRISTGQFHACPLSLFLGCDFSALGSRWRS